MLQLCMARLGRKYQPLIKAPTCKVAVAVEARAAVEEAAGRGGGRAGGVAAAAAVEAEAAEAEAAEAILDATQASETMCRRCCICKEHKRARINGTMALQRPMTTGWGVG